MSAQNESPAAAIARAHVEAWTNHDFDTARGGLAPDVRVTATTTQPRHGRICPNEPWFLRPGPGDPRPGYPGRDRGSPKRGITLLSKRVMMLIWSPRRVRTISPFACRTAPCGSPRYTPNAGWPLARVATSR